LVKKIFQHAKLGSRPAIQFYIETYTEKMAWMLLMVKLRPLELIKKSRKSRAAAKLVHLKRAKAKKARLSRNLKRKRQPKTKALSMFTSLNVAVRRFSA